MKKLFCSLALALCMSPMAQAQVQFDSGSARPNNPGAATREVNRQRVAPPPPRVYRKLVRCRDGSRRVASSCRRHGGVARRHT
ncbi:hypothetical protein BH11PSE11_BH11PSE11_33150 [soil metagenome]